MEIVIIGASAAGVAAAKAVRQRAPESVITIVSLDGCVYSRVKLHQFLSGEKDAAGIGFVAADFFEQNRIRWMPGRRAVSLSPEEKRVLLDGGEAVGYDRLLIATGADYVIPPIPHFREAPNVYGLRTLEDAKRISREAQQGKRCVVIGSGLVGLDAAAALTARGVRVTLVELADRISPLQLDARAAKPYQERFEAHGCAFRLSAKATGARTDADGRIAAVVLEDGELPCDFVVSAAGVRASVAFLEGSGIAVGRGVTVDRFLRTSAPDVYAAGDAAGVAGSWAAAVKQGGIAGENMCGRQAEYVPDAPRNALNYYGLATVSLGGALPEGGEVLTKEDGESYRRVTLEKGVPVHVVLQGDIAKAAMWQKLMNEKRNVLELGKPVFELTMADLA